MALHDPADKAMIRLEVRRFASRCDNNEALAQRADSLRELARLAVLPLPYRISDDPEARDLQHRLLQVVEDCSKDLITAQIAAYVKADEFHREGLRSKMLEDWLNLTGPLAHLRNWAKSKLTLAQQQLQL